MVRIVKPIKTPPIMSILRSRDEYSMLRNQAVSITASMSNRKSNRTSRTLVPGFRTNMAYKNSNGLLIKFPM